MRSLPKHLARFVCIRSTKRARYFGKLRMTFFFAS